MSETTYDVFDEEADQGRGGWVTSTWPTGRPVFTGELYRVVERPATAEQLFEDAPWAWASVGYGHPRTYVEQRIAEGIATRLRNGYKRAGIAMEVAVQRAPIGAWERVLSEADMIDLHMAEEQRRREAGEPR